MSEKQYFLCVGSSLNSYVKLGFATGCSPLDLQSLRLQVTGPLFLCASVGTCLLQKALWLEDFPRMWET